MAQHMIPFGVGTRLCGGQNLVQIMMRIIIAVLVKNFNISANSDETNDRTMEIRDAFVRIFSFLFTNYRAENVHTGDLQRIEGV